MLIISPICGFISFFLGVIVLFGWYTHSPTLIQVHPSFVAMQYNTAWGFLICGIGLLAIFKSKINIFKSCGLILILLGGLTLTQYIFGLNFGIDQFFMEHYIDQETSHPGRMAPNTALCFFLAGLSFLNVPKVITHKISATFLAILGAIIWALGTVAFTGYAMELETAYGWSNLTRMAVHTASGFMVIGMGIVAHAWKIEMCEKMGTPHWLPLLAALVCFTITLLLWQAQSSEQDRGIFEQINVAAKNIESELTSELGGRIEGLGRIAKRWERVQIPDQKEFSEEISLFSRHHISMVGALWMDANLKLKYWNPIKIDSNLISNLEKQKNRIQKMVEAKNQKKLVALGGFKLSTDERVFLIHIPLYKNEKFQGLLVGILQPRNLLKETLDTQIDEGISAEVLGPAELAEEKSYGIMIKNPWTVERNISFMGVSAKAKVSLNEEGLKKKSSLVSSAILIVGAFISLLLALIIGIAQRSRRYALQTRMMNLELEKERTHLEERVHERTQELEDSEDQFRSLVNNIPGTSYRCLLDAHWTMLYMSDNIRDLAGYPPSDFIKNTVRTFDSIIHTEDKEKVKEVIESSIAKKVQYTIEYRIFHSNGKELWVREKGQASFDEQGEPQHLNGAIFDITDSRNAETKLRHSERMTRAIIENALECIIRIDEKGIIQSFNPAAEKTFGYQAREVVDENIKMLLPEPYRSEHDEYLKKYLTSGVKNIIGFTRELEAMRKDGSLFPIELSVSEIYLGEERFFNGMIRDITRRKEIEQNLQKINKQSDFALDLTKSGYWHIPLDDSGYYNSSEKAVAIFGDPPRPDHRYNIMKEWYKNVEAGDKEIAEETLEKYKGAIEGRYPLYDATFAYKRPVDGNIVWIHALAYVVRDENGKAKEMHGVAQDITESKLLEEQLREASLKAEQANKAKSLFISSMSHEIRTPMNAILGYSQILERDKELKGKQRKGVESIHRAGKHLLDIINDILDFSKIEAGKMELHPHDFDLGSLVQDLVIIFSGKCKEKKLELKTEGVQEGQKIHVHAEAGKMRQVLVNLIGNAVKFTDSGSVSLRVMPLAGEQFYFEVKDTGQGIPTEKLKTIFESFQQDEEGIKKGGTGLGLAIAKSIISAMGGELQVESEVNKGSRFFFTLDLPSAKESVRDKDDSLSKVMGLAKNYSVKAVLIDDNKDNLEVLAGTLQEIGIETVEAENGPDGLELISKIVPDILFVDYHMPGMDGLEVTKRVKEKYGEEKIKIVMISASTFAHHREQYMKEGVHGFVGKPFLREEILGVMTRLLGLEYEYEESTLAENILEEKDFDFSSIKIPKDLHKSVTEMASMGMMTELEELLPQIESSCSEGPHLSAHIKGLIDQFDTDGIVTILEKIGNE